MNRKITTFAILLVITGIYLNNASSLAPSSKETRAILAHRGLHQTYNPIGVTEKTCTASRIDTPSHDYIENTLPSIQAAIDLGVDIIEFDVHPTTDGEFVVFHDWELACKTNGKGIVRKQSSHYLKTLDIGYGYTADNGKTYPFRGKYVNAMPTLGEVLNTFPATQFMINIKSGNVEEAKKLTAYLQIQENANRERLSVLGGGEGINIFADLNSDIKTISKSKSKSCVQTYILLGWSGYMPNSCHNSFVAIPANYQWLIWGWPNRFEERLKKAGSRSILMGPHQKNKANSGIDSIEDLINVPDDFGGIIFTNRIDLIGNKK